MMRKLTLAILLCASLGALQACSLGYVWIIFNNSGTTLGLKCGNKEIELLSGSYVRVPSMFSEQYLSHDIGQTFGGGECGFNNGGLRIGVRFGAASWSTYEMHVLNVDHWNDYRGFTSAPGDRSALVYRVQFEPDQKAYIVKKESRFPDPEVSNSAQPLNYPVSPISH